MFLRYGYESTLCKPNSVPLPRLIISSLAGKSKKDGFCHVFISITFSSALSTLRTQFNKDGQRQMKTKLAKRLSSIFKLSPEFFEIKNQNQIEKESEGKGG